MKFNQFTLRQLLANTDYLVGYDSETGSYIRISKDDLIETLAYPEMDPMNVSIQYKSSGGSWHNTMTSGDRYIRFKIADYAWSNAIDIQSLCPQYQLEYEPLEDNQSEYKIKDDGHRKVFSVSIKTAAEFIVSLQSGETNKILISNESSNSITVTISSEDGFDIVGASNVNIVANGRYLVELQRVKTRNDDVVVVKSTRL